ncbi:MAG: alpha/beta fold hydrolase [Acidimicrobiia bacterium]|nr:alpha/beta fold hydrolase [Acidimicrobiia bacterium]
MKRPSIISALAEPARASGEFVTSVGLLPFYRLLPRGDGHPVLVLPGFMAADGSTSPLRLVLTALGYETHPWGLGRNMGPTERVMDGMPELLHRIAGEAGRSVSIVGWSLGGVYGRDLAARHPDLVRSLVTLGTPTRPAVRYTSNAAPLYNALRNFHASDRDRFDDGEPLERPVTAIHTRSDGIIHWKTCLIRETANSENLRVRGSHVGLGHNPAVIYIIADRLAQPEGRWTPFVAPAAYRRVVTAVSA